MKKYLIFIIIGIIVFSSIPIYAMEYNDGPLPEKEHYMHFTITCNIANGYGNTIPYFYDLWLYAVNDTQDLIMNTSYDYGGISLVEYHSPTPSKLILYSNGNADTTRDYAQIFPRVINWSNEYNHDLAYLINDLNDGNLHADWYDLQNDLNYDLDILFNTFNITNEQGDTLVFPQAQPIPQYEDGSTLLINSGNSSGNNPLATITVKYKLDQRTIGNLSDWSFKLESTPNRYMKVISHTPLDHLYPQPSLYRYGEIVYQGLSIEGNNTFKAIATNSTLGTVLNSNLWVYDYYKGFIDVNMDGQDDRYNSGDDSQGPIPNDDNPLLSDLSLPVREDYEDGILGTIAYFMNLIFTYISTPFRWIATSLQTMANWLIESMGWITSINAFFGAFFSYLPTEITGAISVLVFVIVIFAILKVMRG